MILMHGGNSLRVNTIPSGMVYLTYFDGIVSTDNPVSPISKVGEPGVWYNGSYSASTARIPSSGNEYAGMPALQLPFQKSIYANTYPAPTVPATTFQNLFVGGNSISIETILYVPGFTSEGGANWMGIGIELATGKYFTLGINTYSSDRGILVGFPFISNYYAFYPASGFHSFKQDGDKTVSFASDDVNERFGTGVHHLAIVIDRMNNNTRGYIDGVLAGTMDYVDYDYSYINITPYNSLNHYILISQFAISSVDRSTDNGATYPVPVTPYVKF